MQTQIHISISVTPETLTLLFKLLQPGAVIASSRTEEETAIIEPEITKEPKEQEQTDVAALPLRGLFLMFDARPSYRLAFLMLVSSKIVNGRLRSAARFFYPQVHFHGFERLDGDGHWSVAFERFFEHAIQLRLPARVNLEDTMRQGFEEKIWADIQDQIATLLDNGSWRKDFKMAAPDNYKK